jgi:chemotaxis protein histidine kinase CheA
MAAKAHEISLEAGSKMAAAMKDVINAAAGLSGFVIESARDLVQYMVRRGQMTQEEADKLIREVELATPKRKPAALTHAPAKSAHTGHAAHPSISVKKPLAFKPAAKAPAAKAHSKPAAKKAAVKKAPPKKAAKKPAPKKPAPKKPAPKKPAPKKPAPKKPAPKKPAPKKPAHKKPAPKKPAAKKSKPAPKKSAAKKGKRR